jgi:nucleobase:cation symporter-1, NCS1 family
VPARSDAPSDSKQPSDRCAKRGGAWSVEAHGIDFVPEAERYGGPARLFSIWFSINLSIVCLTTGTLGVFAGLSLAWTVVALTLGSAIGTVFMAAHSAQGPHLGVPQMIQSRAQFGVLGAALPLVAVVITYTLYTAADGVVVRDTVKAVAHVGDDAAIIGFGLITLVIAFVGYELIHRLGAVLAIVSFLLLLTAFLITATRGHSSTAGIAPWHSFSHGVFMVTMTQAAAWSLSFGPYVADYSRYLPSAVSTRRTFWFTACGNFVGATLVMAFGAYLAAAHPDIARDPGTGIAGLFGSGAPWVRVLIAIGVLQGNVMNLYSAYMSSATIFTGVRGMSRLGIGTKFLSMGLLIAAATLIAVLAQYRFDLYFGDMLSIMIYILIPWSSINLTDYYYVRKGHYAIMDFFRADGIYGRYRWRVIGVYIAGIALQIPFMQLSFFDGAIARLLGADISWIPGLIIPAILYALLERPEPPAPIHIGDASRASATNP